MARMHSRKKGKSSSKKPLGDKKSTWQRYDKKEATLLVVKLAKEQKTPSQIGSILRDSYGIPDIKKITNKSLTQILKDEKIAQKLPEDILSLIKRSIQIMKHLETNKKDQPSVRGLQLTISKIGRLAKYYKAKGKIPQDWRYTKAQAKLLIE
jgi:small subunit ribosomal protein S15|tara:strand:- start:107 stop:562 length:456 start_codon:yes stop_codon:yes gene_type:complete